MSDIEEIKVIVATGELRRKIEEAGKLQEAASLARKRYDKCREQLDKMLKKEVGDDLPAYARTYWAIRSHDKADKIDPVELLKWVQNPVARRKLLKVNIGVAREEFSKQMFFSRILESETNEETTLHVYKIQPKKEEA